MREVPKLFWIKWAASDNIERVELIKDLSVTKTFAKLLYPKLDTPGSLDVVATMLNSYFEDLYEEIGYDRK